MNEDPGPTGSTFLDSATDTKERRGRVLVIQAAAGIRRVPKALLHVFSYPPIVAGLLVGCVVLVAATAAAATAGAIAAPPWLLQPRWLVVELAAAAVVAITTAAAAAAAAAVPMLLLLMPPMLFSTLVLLLPYTLLLRRPPLLPLGFAQLALLLHFLATNRPQHAPCAWHACAASAIYSAAPPGAAVVLVAHDTRRLAPLRSRRGVSSS